MTNTEQSRQWRERIGAEAYRAYCRARYKRHREATLARNKRWKDKNRERYNYQNYCKAYREKNLERRQAYQRNWYANNRERHKSYVTPEARSRNLVRLKNWLATLTPVQQLELRQKQWANYMAKHRDAHNAKRREHHDPIKSKAARIKWKNSNPERYKALQKAAQKRHQPRRLHHQRLRELRKRSVTIGDLTEIAKVYERRKWWRQWFKVGVDHIIPLSRGGMHEAKNLQIIYDLENFRKHNSLSYKPKVVFA